MDFTRQPLIESVITAKEGCKLVVRSSKGSGQEEYFVDAVEVVSFGNSFFFRSLEKPKSFLVPVSDYEILEVREARMVLKNVGIDRSIKIAGGKELPQKQQQTPKENTPKQQQQQQQSSAPSNEEEELDEETTNRSLDKKRDRRRTIRRRKRGEEAAVEPAQTTEKNLLPPPPINEKPLKPSELKKIQTQGEQLEKVKLSTTVISSVLPPPTGLISDSIDKYKDNKLFQGVFISRDPIQEPSSTEPLVSEESAVIIHSEEKPLEQEQPALNLPDCSDEYSPEQNIEIDIHQEEESITYSEESVVDPYYMEEQIIPSDFESSVSSPSEDAPSLIEPDEEDSLEESKE